MYNCDNNGTIIDIEVTQTPSNYSTVSSVSEAGMCGCGVSGLLWALVLAGCLMQVCHPSSHPSYHPHRLRHAGEEEEEEMELDREGCSSVNFRSPHHCRPEDCDFSVRWVDSGERVNFTLTAIVEGNHPATSVWAAVGFSDNPLMGDTDVVTCLVDSEGHASIHDGWNAGHAHVEDQNQTDSGLQLVGKITISKQRLMCSFSRLKVGGISGQDKNLTSPLHVLVASGRLEQDSPVMQYHGKNRRVASHCECDFTKCDKICGECSVFIYMLLKLHGVVMCVVFLFFFPTGVLVARYYRLIFPEAWFKAHRVVMVLGALGTVVGLGLILGHTGGKFTVGVHQIVGIICICLSIIQATYGFLRPHVGPTIQRRVFTTVHRVLAATIVLLGNVALFWGSLLFHSSVLAWMIAFLVLSSVVNVAFVGMLEYLSRTRSFLAPPIGYHKVTKEDELSDSEEEEEVYIKEEAGGNGRGKEAEEGGTQLFRMEKGLLLVFLLQTLSFAGVMSMLILKYDSTT